MPDFERGAKVTGSKFYFLTGDEAVREWKLINYMLDFHQKRGWKFVIPPFLINHTTAQQAGILPKFEDEYYQTKDGFILIPTAETPLVGMHSDEIIPEAELPIKYVAYSPCFRREAGALGKSTKGYRRVHQFNKVELFAICKPEQSDALHKEMIAQVKEFLDSFDGLEYRCIELTPEDRAPWSNSTFDIELKYEEEWLEVSSISNTGDNQSKIAQIRYRPSGGGKPVKCHLLNGSGVALPRLMMALSASTPPASPPAAEPQKPDASRA